MTFVDFAFVSARWVVRRLLTLLFAIGPGSLPALAATDHVSEANLVLPDLADASLAAFFIWTFPANRATTNWTAMPENWEALRRNWEMGHAIGAVCTLVALVSVTLAALRAPQTTLTAG